jgi:hypothetical protein
MKSRSNSARWTLLVSLALAGACLVIAPVAEAEPTAADRISAKDFMRDGKELRAKGDHAGAAKKFAAAYALVPSPITGLALANEQLALGQLLEARETLGAIDRMPVRLTETEDGRRARAEASALYVDVDGRIPVLVVTVSGAPAGAAVEVTVDGSPKPLVALEAGLRLAPGKHVVRASAAGATPQSSEISLTERERRALSLSLAPSAPTREVTTLFTPRAATPATTNATPPVDRGDPGAKSRAGAWIAPVVVGGAGVVAVGVSAVLALTAKSSYDGARTAHCATGACDPTGKSQIDDARTRGDVATGVMIAGGVLVATGAAIWLLSPSGREERSTRVGVGLGSILVEGRF